MASTWKHPESKYWFACYTDSDGRQRKRSTKTTNRKDAQRIADELERAYRKRLTAEQILRLYSEVRREITGDEIPTKTVRAYLDEYLASRKSEVSVATLAAYRGVAKRFLEWLGADAETEMNRITKKHIAAYRNGLRDGLSARSVNHQLKILRVFFKAAKGDSVVDASPCDGVPVLLETGSNRRGFSADELRVVMKEIRNTEWESLVRFGLYTGQRLGDVSQLRWRNIDLEANEIRLVTSKSGKHQKTVIIPICKPLLAHILKLPSVDDERAFVHPLSASRNGSHLSREFGEIMARCGFRREAPAHHGKIEGREGMKREGNELSFHSLRHSAVSLMKNAGISAAIVEDIVGHDTEAVARLYTHFDNETKMGALNKLPEI